MNSKVDEYINNAKKWHNEFEKLRSIVLECNLNEELKWGVPCYTYSNLVEKKQQNIVLIHGFKEYCALLFMKGALLNDSNGILIQQTENVQSGRQIRFTSLKEIEEQEAILKAYIFEAIEVEKAGLKVAIKPHADYVIPEEFQLKMDRNQALKTAFESLTPGRQRAYILHFSGSKQAKTREARIENYMQRILIGKGLNDCICGMSKRMPNCDGSHKFS
jgi:uncharacterized protein YdeI (YjbR/CyaY-like superfamily)